MGNRTIQDLQMMQAAPLNTKIAMTKRRIRDWVNEFGLDGVYVSFSGGKDSTVLLTIAREVFPSIKGVFCDTGLEFPEIRSFVKTWDNIDWIRPKMNFRQVIEKYGYPFISKEVAECVWGARKYLTSVIESASPLNERTNERTNERHKWHFQKYRQLCAEGEYAKPYVSVEKHTDNHFTDAQVWQAVQSCRIGEGAARDFANLTGIRTNQPRTTDPRLWSGYRQFQTATSSGNIPEKRETDDGEYP